MNELKTLNEIAIEFKEMNFIDSALKEQRQLIKQNAIKWVKFLQSKIDKESLCLECGEDFPTCHDFEETGNKPCGKATYGKNCLSNADYESTDILGAIIILKIVHNITEEDLK